MLIRVCNLALFVICVPVDQYLGLNMIGVQNSSIFEIIIFAEIMSCGVLNLAEPFENGPNVSF